jgi:basic membrane lipoprotein Med (substrate-binding protein (PBP1-ABC) superfamily)/DNA-binding SARP family transcriptional activator
VRDREPIEFLVLGPLEVRVDGCPRPLGGAKQRAVLGLFLLHANQVVPIDRIVDEVWGDEPPPSAAHTIESYVSRLRRQIGRYGPSIVRQGGGYRLDLAGARLDARTAEELLRSASEASSAGDDARAAQLAREALRLWRGPALRDAPLHGAGRAETDELDELRLRVVERLVEAELALGLHEDAIPRLRPLVDGHPYRERFVAQLMLALYRAGRPAEALDVYERSRQALAEDVGLRPSAELQRLSGEIVRHDPRLAPPRGSADASPVSGRAPDAPRAEAVASVSPRRRHLTRRNIVGALMALAATVSAAVAFASGASPGSGSKAGPATAHVAAATRVGLVFPRQPATSDDIYAPYIDGLLGAKRLYGVDTETLVVDPSAKSLSNRVRNKLRHLDLVLLAGPEVHDRFVDQVRRNPDTHFVFLDPDPDWEEAQVNTLSNSTDIFFIEGPASYLAGYMGALMEKRRPKRTGRVVVSIVAGDPIVNKNLVGGFRIGARAAVPGVVVRQNYSHDFSHPSVCKTIANRQIDAGSRIVFAAAGTCSLGALSAAAVRGVWAVGVNIDRSYLGSHILVSVEKRVDRAVGFAIRSFLDGTLEGGSLDIGMERQAVGIADISPAVPAEIRRNVEKQAERHLKEWASWSTPQVRRGPG